MNKLIYGLILSALIVCAVTFAAHPASAKSPPVYTGIFSSQAVSGYDTVAYFADGKAVEGKEEFKTEYNGATWLFSSAKNLASFKSNPEKYAPQYGGYCAYAVGAKNSLVSADPQAWKIVDGKLYLNYDKDIQKDWEKDIPGFIKSGDQNWIGLSKQ